MVKLATNLSGPKVTTDHHHHLLFQVHRDGELVKEINPSTGVSP